MAEPTGLGEVVSDHDDGFLERTEDRAEIGLELGADHGIEGPHRLIEQDDPRVEHQRSHQADPLPLTAGKLRGESVEPLGREPRQLAQLERAGRRSVVDPSPGIAPSSATLSRALKCGNRPPSWMT